jgi:hypothetical protein
MGSTFPIDSPNIKSQNEITKTSQLDGDNEVKFITVHQNSHVNQRQTPKSKASTTPNQYMPTNSNSSQHSMAQKSPWDDLSFDDLPPYATPPNQSQPFDYVPYFEEFSGSNK